MFLFLEHSNSTNDSTGWIELREFEMFVDEANNGRNAINLQITPIFALFVKNSVINQRFKQSMIQ